MMQDCLTYYYDPGMHWLKSASSCPLLAPISMYFLSDDCKHRVHCRRLFAPGLLGDRRSPSTQRLPDHQKASAADAAATVQCRRPDGRPEGWVALLCADWWAARHPCKSSYLVHLFLASSVVFGHFSASHPLACIHVGMTWCWPGVSTTIDWGDRAKTVCFWDALL